MPAPYTELNLTDTQSLYSLARFLSPYDFMPLVLGAIWVIAMIGSISEGRQLSRAFIFASFITAILSMILALTGLLNPQFMYACFLLVAIGVVWYKLDNAPGL